MEIDIAAVTLGEVAGWTIAIFVALTGIIQVSPIKIKPWTWIARAIGRAVNGEVIEKVGQMQVQLDSIEAHQKETEAKEARARILRFADEIYNRERHSKEHFDDILADISSYDHYCSEHPMFENDRTVMASQQIKDTYRKCQREHSFLA